MREKETTTKYESHSNNNLFQRFLWATLTENMNACIYDWKE